MTRRRSHSFLCLALFSFYVVAVAATQQASDAEQSSADSGDEVVLFDSSSVNEDEPDDSVAVVTDLVKAGTRTSKTRTRKRTRSTQHLQLVRHTTASADSAAPVVVVVAVNSDSDSKNSTQPHCTDHTDCQSCTDASWCHWCGSAKGCHVQGSASGCVWGETCPGPPVPPAPAPTPASNNDTCLAHTSCADCAMYSRWCHWCAHDNACHLIGSLYGCVRGVDCYDITHCQRAVPEPMDEVDAGPFVVPELRLIPFILAAVLATLTLCCATLCCCAVRVTKEAYNDLVRDVTATTPLLLNTDGADDDHYHDHHHDHHHANHHHANHHHAAAAAPTAASTMSDRPEETVRVLVVLAESDEAAADPALEQDLEVTAHRQEDPPAAELSLAAAATSIPSRATRRGVATTTTTRSSTTATTTATATTHNRQSVDHRRRPPRRTIHRLYHACVGCYCLTLLFVLATSLAIIKYFPQPPAYSICSDAVAWQSIVEAMARLSVAADFQLLASIENPNYLDVDVVVGSGTFYHKNDLVGSFDIPATTIQRRSITDLLVTATFAPDKWKALSIGTEYYAGTLMLTLNSQVTIRIPMLFDYTFTVTVKDLLVDVNEAADRHLCACPTWSDTRTQVPHWMTLRIEDDETNLS